MYMSRGIRFQDEIRNGKGSLGEFDAGSGNGEGVVAVGKERRESGMYWDTLA